MPTYLRKYYIMKISDENRKAAEEREQTANQMRSHGKAPKTAKPGIPKSPTYKTKAGKK